jgi:hypothetical protein
MGLSEGFETNSGETRLPLYPGDSFSVYMYTCITSYHQECISYPQHGDVQGSTVGWDLGGWSVKSVTRTRTRTGN